ncbi:MAG: hypothetical protein WC602_01540 [archaeon]
MAGTRTFEAFIGATLLLSTLAISYSFLPHVPQQVDLRSFGESALEALSFDQNFRTLIAGADSNEKIAPINAKIAGHFFNPFYLQVCDSNNVCYGSPAEGSQYLTVNYLYEGNSTDYRPKTVYFHMKVTK